MMNITKEMPDWEIKKRFDYIFTTKSKNDHCKSKNLVN